MKFTPYKDCVEVEPLYSESVIKSDDKSKVEVAKIIKVNKDSDIETKVGDYIFFRPHGFFELPEFEGTKRYIVRLHPEFILGFIKNVAK